MPKAKAKTSDARPTVAIGYIEHHVADVSKSAAFLETIGVRPIFRQPNFAVMELRGGTHILLAKSKDKIEAGTAAPFDFIVDDVDEFRASCVKQGMKASRMSRGSIHDWFELTDPSRYVPFLPLPEAITLKALKPKAYKEKPATLGEYLRKRRMELGLSQAGAGKRCGVRGARFGAWERNEVEPQEEFARGIRTFLGYDPHMASVALYDA